MSFHATMRIHKKFPRLTNTQKLKRPKKKHELNFNIIIFIIWPESFLYYWNQNIVKFKVSLVFFSVFLAKKQKTGSVRTEMRRQRQDKVIEREIWGILPCSSFQAVKPQHWFWMEEWFSPPIPCSKMESNASPYISKLRWWTTTEEKPVAHRT